mgnify:CR=1 FL=1
MNWQIEPLDANSHRQREAWRELAQRTGASVVLHPEFVFTCAETLGNGRLLFASYGPQEQPLALAIIDLSNRIRPEAFVESQMPLGAWLQVPDSSLDLACDALIRHAPLALQFSIRQLDPRFIQRPEASSRLDTVNYIETAWVETTGIFDEYWAGRGKNLRTNMKKQRDKLTKQGTTTRMEILTGC